MTPLKALKALGALAVAAALLAGVPLLLARTVGNPLTSVSDLLAGDLNDRAVLAVLGAVAYLAWAQFAVAFIAELATQLHRATRRGTSRQRRHRRGDEPARTPLTFAFQRHFAHHLVAAILLLSTGASLAGAALPGWAATGTVTTSSAATQAGPSSVGSAAAQDHSAASLETVRIVVGDGGPQTWWDLAAAHLGAGDRWPEIWALNTGSVQADGTVLRTPGILKTGWTVTIPAPPAAEGEDVIVQPGDTLSGIAAHHGTSDWTGVWQANKDRAEPHGQTYTNPDDIQPGWIITIPAPAAQPTHGDDVTVKPGDTLSEIAAHHGIADWNTLWEANKDRAEPDGQTLDDPDVIWPGWTITIPDPTPHPTTTTDPAPAATKPAGAHPTAGSQAGADTPAPPAHGTPNPPATPTTDPPPHTASAPPAATGTAKATDPTSPAASSASSGATSPTVLSPSATSPEPAATSPTTPAPGGAASTPAPTATLAGSGTPSTGTSADPAPTAPATDTSATTASNPDRGSSETVPLIAGGAAVLLAGAGYLALTRYRRRQERHRRPGHPTLTTPRDLQPIEASLRRAGQQAADDVGRLDAALRGLAKRATSLPAFALPDIIAAHLRPEGIDLHLATPHPDTPTGWTANDDGDIWTLPADETAGYTPHLDRPYTPAPYPLLATIGHTPDGHPWLIDLEHFGTVQIAGDRVRTRNLARFVAAELALNTWSETNQITVCGLGDDLAHLTSDHLTCTDDHGRAMADFTRTWRSVDPSRDTVSERVNLDGPEADAPVALIATTAAEALPATDGRRRGHALVLAGDSADAPSVGCLLTIDADGRIVLPGLGVAVIAEQLPPGTASDLADLLEAAAATDQAPAAPLEEWAVLADPQPEPEAEPEPAGPGSVGADREAPPARREPPQRVLPLPVDIYEMTAATTAEDVDALAPPVSRDTRLRVEASLSDLDRDLADWYDPACTRPRISVLGPITVRARESLPTDKPRLAWNTEIVAYLATKGRPVTPDEYGTALWPDDPDITHKPKLRQSIHIVRRWLGTSDRTGTPHLPAHPGDRAVTYELHDALLDADLFRQLRLRGVARGDDGLADLETALEFVTGRPYDRRRPGGYGWLADDALDHQYVAMIIDLAHTVATAHLAAGRPEKAIQTAHVALRTGTSADTPLLDLLHANKQLGNHAEADLCLRRIMNNHDADVEEDLPPRTFEILHRNGWLTTSTTSDTPFSHRAAAGSRSR